MQGVPVCVCVCVCVCEGVEGEEGEWRRQPQMTQTQEKCLSKIKNIKKALEINVILTFSRLIRTKGKSEKKNQSINIIHITLSRIHK